jgi:hypothetical protein
MNYILAQAVIEYRIVTFWYDGLPRTVEPHIYGINTALAALSAVGHPKPYRNLRNIWSYPPWLQP